MHTANYRQKTGQRILILVALLGTLCFFVLCLAGCSYTVADDLSMESWLRELGVNYRSESRLAIPTVRNKDKRGRYTIPNCPLCGAHPIDIWTGYHCGKHRFETPSILLN